jgi:hypothetical protein
VQALFFPHSAFVEANSGCYARLALSALPGLAGGSRCAALFPQCAKDLLRAFLPDISRRSRRATALARPRWSTEMSTAAIALAHCSLIQHGRLPTQAHLWQARGRRALGLKALEPRPQPMIRKSLQRSAG